MRGLRVLLREEGVTFQRLKTWKISTDPDYAVKKARVEHLYAIVDGEVISGPGNYEVQVLDADPRRVKRIRITTRKERPQPRKEREARRRDGAPEASAAQDGNRNPPATDGAAPQ